MPELPEVEVVRRGLLPRVTGRLIERIEVFDDRAVRRQSGGAAAFAADVTGARVTGVARRGKFLWWRLAGPGGTEDIALMVHLGMSGQLRVRDVARDDATSSGAPQVAGEGPAPDPHRHRRITLRLDDGTDVDFLDQRLFGGMWTSPLAPTGDGRLAAAGSSDDLLPLAAAHIARDVLDPVVDLAAVARQLRRRTAPVKALLLSQDLISGIGNIYADEALWAARAHPTTPGAELSQIRAHRILQAARTVMESALAVGGTSFDALYVNVDGRSGYFARSLAVYGRQGEPCPRCGTPIRRVVLMNRSSHLCPRCQQRR